MNREYIEHARKKIRDIEISTLGLSMCLEADSRPVYPQESNIRRKLIRNVRGNEKDMRDNYQTVNNPYIPELTARIHQSSIETWRFDAKSKVINAKRKRVNVKIN